MFALNETFGFSDYQKQGGTFAIRLLILLIICVFDRPANAVTNIYVFVPGQSTVVQTGGFAGVNETCGIEGKFRLTVDFDAGFGSFDKVDANLTEPTGFLYSQSLGEIFNMTALAGTIIDETTIQFEGKTTDGTESDVSIKLVLNDDSVRLTGKIIPPPNSADMFLYELDAVAAKKYAAGTGEPNNPYQIATAVDLIALGNSPEDYDKHFILTADIDLDPNLPGGRVFTSAVIAPDTNEVEDFQGTAFTGSFNGNGHIITKLTIRNITGDYLGLFGKIGIRGRVHNLGMENTLVVGVDGSYCVGSLAGYNHYGRIENCYAGGSVSVGEESRNISGLVGSNVGDISYCYTTCSVSHGHDAKYIGGLAGSNNGTIIQCYASGSMISKGSSSYLGGLVGIDYYDKTSNCFWNIETSGLSESDGGTGLTSAQMQDPNVFMDAGWDFIREPDGPSDIWAEPEGGGYPILSWQLPESQWPLLPSFSGGTGELNNPYLISTPDELNSIGYNPRLMAAHFKLIKDIDLADGEFFSISNEIFRFSGIFDGNDHTISNFIYISTSTDHAGFFGYIDGPHAEVRNLGLIDPNVNTTTESTVGSLIGRLENGIITGCYVQSGSISGNSYVSGFEGNIVGARSIVGGLVGVNREYGTITDCHASCSVFGNWCVGGLLGAGHGIITNCKFSGEVSGNDCVGGLVGSNSGKITNGASSGGVSGNDFVGGLLGENFGEITNCNSTVSVLSSGSEAGGLVGYNNGTITNSYAAGNTSGNSIVGGLVGSNGYIQEWDLYWEYPGYISNCYSTGCVSGTSTEGGFLGYNAVGSVTSSLWDKESSGQYDMCGSQSPEASGCNNANGKTTAEMQMASTFTSFGWDFVDETENGSEDIWWILEGQDYPRLWWELIEDESGAFAENLPAEQ